MLLNISYREISSLRIPQELKKQIMGRPMSFTPCPLSSVVTVYSHIFDARISALVTFYSSRKVTYLTLELLPYSFVEPYKVIFNLLGK